MKVQLIAKAANVLLNILAVAVAERKAKLEQHGLDTEKKLRAQRRNFELARKDLEVKQANKAVQLYKSLGEAEAALNGIKK